MLRTTPPLDDNARRLLGVVDRMPVQTAERDRVVAALELVATGEWTRVVVALTDAQVQGLSQAAPRFTPDNLAHVLEVAATVARVYGFEHVGVAHVAVGLAATSREPGAAVDAMAEAFGLGVLENSADIVDQHLTWLEDSGGDPCEQPADRAPSYGETLRARHWRLAATLTHLGLRGAAFCVLLVIAAHSSNAWAWVVAFAALVSTRDAREALLPVGDEVSPVQPPTRWPWLGWVAVSAGALGLWTSASVVVVLYLLLEAVSCAGVRVVSRYLWMEGATEGSGISRRVASLVSVVDGYATRQRCLRFGAVVLLAVLPSVAAAGVSRAWPLYVTVAVFAARRWALSAVVASAVAIGLAHAPAWLLLSAWAGGAAARGVIAWIGRPPAAAVPVPGPGIGALLSSEGRTQLRARRLVRNGRPAAALISLDAARHAADPALLALHGWALLHSGRPGEAKNTVSALPQNAPTRALITCLAELDLSNTAAASRAMAAIGAIDEDTPTALWYEALTARIRLTLLNEGGSDHLTDGIAAAIPRRLRHADLLPSVTLLRLASESTLPSSPALSSLLAGFGAVLSRPERYTASAGFIALLGRSRPLALENMRCLARRFLADARAGSTGTDTISRLSAVEGTPGYLMRMDRPIEAASVLNALADELAGVPQYRHTALLSRIEALAMLNAVRHQLNDAEDRRHWWSVFGRTLENAMREAAAGQDWQALAELIESARLQLGPDNEGSTFDASRTVAPFIRVRGTSRLEQAHWYRPGEQPPGYALEDLAQRVLGPGTWWWSTWSAGAELFWALVPPDAPVSGGVLAMDRDSVLSRALSDLRDALPARYPGESDDAWEERLLGSPLVVGPAQAETNLARRLGLLLPSPLVEALLRASQPLPLAIAPAAELGNVPWACVVIPERPPGDLRLIERCALAIAPPAGLLAAVAARVRAATGAPLALAVIDPGGALPGSTASELPAARRLLDILPPGVHTVAPREDVSVADFADRLRAVNAESSAVFACHTGRLDGSASGSGIMLRPGIAEDACAISRPEVLSAGLLIAEPSRFPMPRQVLMLACDSADLGNTAAGEWLVLGPALLWAGADRLIVTSYPIIDTVQGQDDVDVIDSDLLHLLIEQQPIAEGLRAVQLAQLAQWRTARRRPWDEEQDLPRSSPVHWGGHAVMGVCTDPRPLPPLSPVRQRLVRRPVIELLDAAAQHARRAGRCEIGPRDLLLELALHGFEEDLPNWRRLLLRAAAYPLALAPTIFSRRRSPATCAVTTVAPQVQDLLRAASHAARIARHRVVDVEHVLVAVLGTAGSTGRTARALFGWDARQPEVIKDILGDTPHGDRYTGLPELRWLDSSAVTTIYAALDAPVPAHEDSGPRPTAVCD